MSMQEPVPTSLPLIVREVKTGHLLMPEVSGPEKYRLWLGCPQQWLSVTEVAICGGRVLESL